MKTMDILVFGVILTVIAFVITVVLCNIQNIQIQDSVIYTFLGMCGTELATMGGIQAVKIKHKAAFKPPSATVRRAAGKK